MAAAEDLPFACSEDGCTAVSSSFTAAKADALCMIYVFMGANFVCFESVRHIWVMFICIVYNVFWFNCGKPNT